MYYHGPRQDSYAIMAITRARSSRHDKSNESDSELLTRDPGNSSTTKARDREPGQLSEAQDFLQEAKQAYKADVWFKDPINTTELVYNSGLYKTKGGALVLPADDHIRKTALMHSHDTVYCGHPGRERTLHSVPKHFWWPHARYCA